MTNKGLEIKKLFIRSVKIAVGSLIAILLATWMGLQFAASAGIVTLLSVVNTKLDTLKLSIARIVTFFISVIIAYISFYSLNSGWIAFGIYIFIIVLLSHMTGYESTVSVNAVIGTHFLSTMDFSFKFILNEFLIVVLGTCIAIVLNLLTGNRGQRQNLVDDIKYIEKTFQEVLGEMSDYLRHKKMGDNVWRDITSLEDHLEHSLERAHEYHGNVFAAHPEYYIHYMEMCMHQCMIMQTLHYEINKIRELPKQAEIVADFMSYLKTYVTECNNPVAQQKRLNELIEYIMNGELPQTRDEFESQIILYHILMDLDEFLLLKEQFVCSLTDEQRRVYWHE